MSGRPSCPQPNPTPPLNGNGTNSEGGRLRNLMRACGGLTFKAETVPEGCGICIPRQEIKPVITPAESSRIATAMLRCGTGAGSGQVTQSRVRELLSIQGRKNFGSEGVRIERLIQDTVSCASNDTFYNQLISFPSTLTIPNPLSNFVTPSNIRIWFDSSDLASIEFESGTSNLYRWYSRYGDTSVYGSNNNPDPSTYPIPYGTSNEDAFYVYNNQNNLYLPPTNRVITFNSNFMLTSNYTIITISKMLPEVDGENFNQTIYNGPYKENPGGDRLILTHNFGNLMYSLPPGFPDNARGVENPLPYNFNKVCIAVTSDQTADTLYENGVPLGSNTNPLTYIQTVSTNVYPSLMGPNLPEEGNLYATGWIYQLLMYDRALNTSEISTMTSVLLEGNIPSSITFQSTFQENIYNPPLAPTPGCPAPVRFNPSNTEAYVTSNLVLSTNLFHIIPDSNLVVWFDSSNLSTIQFQTGTSNLDRWYSKAGNTGVYGYNFNLSYPATYGVSNQNGFFINNGQNNDWNGVTNSCILFNSNYITPCNYTLFIVSKTLPDGDGDNWIQELFNCDRLNDGVNENRLILAQKQSINILFGLGGGNFRGIDNAGDPYNFNKVCTTFTTSVAADQLFENGTLLNSATNPLIFPQAVSTTTFPSVMGPAGADNRWATGWIYQVLMYSTVLSQAEISTISWGLTNNIYILSSVTSSIVFQTQDPALIIPPYTGPCPLTKDQKY